LVLELNVTEVIPGICSGFAVGVGLGGVVAVSVGGSAVGVGSSVVVAVGSTVGEATTSLSGAFWHEFKNRTAMKALTKTPLIDIAPPLSILHTLGFAV
jgi:hypothetical protein